MIKIRPVVEADIEAFYHWQLDPEAVRMAVFAPRRDRRSHLEKWRAITADADGFARTVLVDGVVAGNLVCWPSDGRRLVGYWLGREFWGRGVATEALIQFVRQIQERPLHALVALSNVASARVLEKCGFVRIEQQTSPADGLEEIAYRLD